MSLQKEEMRMRAGRGDPVGAWGEASRPHATERRPGGAALDCRRMNARPGPGRVQCSWNPGGSEAVLRGRTRVPPPLDGSRGPYLQSRGRPEAPRAPPDQALLGSRAVLAGPAAPAGLRAPGSLAGPSGPASLACPGFLWAGRRDREVSPTQLAAGGTSSSESSCKNRLSGW